MPADHLAVARELITRARELWAEAVTTANGDRATGAALGLVPALADLAESALDLPAPRVADLAVDDLDGTRVGATLAPITHGWGVKVAIGLDEYPHRDAYLDAGTALTMGEGLVALATEAVRRNKEYHG